MHEMKAVACNLHSHVSGTHALISEAVSHTALAGVIIKMSDGSTSTLAFLNYTKKV